MLLALALVLVPVALLAQVARLVAALSLEYQPSGFQFELASSSLPVLLAVLGDRSGGAAAAAPAVPANISPAVASAITGTRRKFLDSHVRFLSVLSRFAPE
ncbi:hypothetical protein BLA24_08370 [Streptomyces cinnamoneus]|uniref:Uncharacterized protein n=1 Tax=Streptomyces cinnamoneus TaxID=53446 RepID=A0A2G1XM61_STRCJ|nr:hypothetical protein [Streptomyces cinnamoneus]PHQ52300.1 hypothetical protein BLA24_08370 [Streptomyces cinnamoneus]